MKVLSGVWPHGTYDGEILFEGKLARSPTSATASVRDRHHPPGARAHPRALDRREHLPRQRAGLPRRHRLVQDQRQKRCRAAGPGGLSEDPDTKIKDIGVGKQQLVEIAKALSKEVKLLILDEPTAALNEEDSQHLLDLMAACVSKGITCIMISHKLNEIEPSPTPSRSSATARRSRPSTSTAGGSTRTASSGHGRPRPRVALPRAHPEDRRESSSRSRLDGPAPARSRADSSARPALHVRRGEIVGFAGLMGAGRTELMRASSVAPTAPRSPGGTITKDGKDLVSCTTSPMPSTPASPTSPRTARRSASTCSTTSRRRRSRPTSSDHPGVVVNASEEYRYAEEYRKECAPRPPRRRGGRQALRWQPAEGRPRQVAVHRA
jgi:putative multiple sugar transport system ATP-binding protein